MNGLNEAQAAAAIDAAAPLLHCTVAASVGGCCIGVGIRSKGVSVFGPAA